MNKATIEETHLLLLPVVSARKESKCCRFVLYRGRLEVHSQSAALGGIQTTHVCLVKMPPLLLRPQSIGSVPHLGVEAVVTSVDR